MVLKIQLIMQIIKISKVQFNNNFYFGKVSLNWAVFVMSTTSLKLHTFVLLDMVCSIFLFAHNGFDGLQAHLIVRRFRS